MKKWEEENKPLMNLITHPDFSPPPFIDDGRAGGPLKKERMKDVWRTGPEWIQKDSAVRFIHNSSKNHLIDVLLLI